MIGDIKTVTDVVWGDVIRLPSSHRVLVDHTKRARNNCTYIAYYAMGRKGNAVLSNDTQVEVLNG